MTSPRRFRFTLRRLMVITALFALVFAGIAWHRARLAREQAAALRELDIRGWDFEVQDGGAREQAAALRELDAAITLRQTQVAVDSALRAHLKAHGAHQKPQPAPSDP